MSNINVKINSSCLKFDSFLNLNLNLFSLYTTVHYIIIVFLGGTGSAYQMGVTALPVVEERRKKKRKKERGGRRRREVVTVVT